MAIKQTIKHIIWEKTDELYRQVYVCIGRPVCKHAIKTFYNFRILWMEREKGYALQIVSVYTEYLLWSTCTVWVRWPIITCFMTIYVPDFTTNVTATFYTDTWFVYITYFFYFCTDWNFKKKKELLRFLEYAQFS